MSDLVNTVQRQATLAGFSLLRPRGDEVGQDPVDI